MLKRLFKTMSPLVHDTCVVDNRMFVLALDDAYRAIMKRVEQGKLLPCAQAVADMLDVPPATGPVEGYYTETPELTHYFQLVRSLQGVLKSEGSKVRGSSDFEQIYSVLSSPIYGRPDDQGTQLLPQGMDPLSTALKSSDPVDWKVSTLGPLASRAARESDDFSLVGLAARAEDAVAIAALRESVVLYAMQVMGSAGGFDRREPRYEWRVDDELAKAANRFIETFNELMRTLLPEWKARPKSDHPTESGRDWSWYEAFCDLPPAASEHADFYYRPEVLEKIVGRCVTIGKDLPGPRGRYYHWAVAEAGKGKTLVVDEFWDAELWTTERYRAERR